MDCIGRVVTRPSDREHRESTLSPILVNLLSVSRDRLHNDRVAKAGLNSNARARSTSRWDNFNSHFDISDKK